MVYKKYTYKDGKRFGPYYYETKRINGHVVTTYLGTEIPKKNIGFPTFKSFLILLTFVLLLFSVYFISSNITGNVSLGIKTNYDFGEQIKGDLKLNVFEGELIPADSIVLINYGNFSKEFVLSDLISGEKIEGNFYANGLTLEGHGLGYGLIGKKVEYPELNFEFFVTTESSSSSGFSEGQTTDESSQESNTENAESETIVESELSESVDSSSEGGGITGAVISDSNIVMGKVSHENDYSYDLNDGDSAQLVSGSVFDESRQLDDDSIKFSVNNNEVVVTTDYSIEKEGFGEGFIGKDSILLSIDLSDLGIIADREDEFKISLIYGAKVIVESSDSIVLSDLNSEEETSNSESEIVVSSNISSNYSSNFSISAEIVNDTLTNSTLLNETLFNQTQLENVTSINQTLINDTLIEVKLVQYGAVIGMPVKWVKTISVDSNDSLNLTVEIPLSAENVTVNKIIDEEFAGDSQVTPESNVDENVIVGITGEVSADLDLERESFFEKMFKLFGITGKVIDEQAEIQEISVELNPEDLAVELEYYTDAPVSVENVIHDNFKVVSVSSPEDVHYQNVLVYTSLPDSSKVKDISSVKIEWVENSTDLNVSFFNDTNFDGYIDYIEWVAPHLSNQTFNIILIISALHLDENRGFISDIYNETRELDDIWSESIPNGHYVRVTFEINLTNEDDITIFPRSSNGTNISEVIIEVYEKDSNNSLVEFSGLNDSEYNKVFLTNLNGTQDTFDLRVLSGSVEFDHIIDPTTWFDGALADIDIIPIDSVTFVMAWINVTGNSTQFAVMNPNGTTVTGPITVGTRVGAYSRVGLAIINSTQFAVGWVNQTTADDLNQIYNISGSNLTNQYFWDGAIGTGRYDIGLTTIGDRYGYCYVDQAEGDVDFTAFFQNGSRIFAGFGEADIDTASTPENNRGNVVDCAAINSTTFGVAWYDAGGTDDVLIRFLNASGSNITKGPIRTIDSAVGTSAAVAMTTLDSNRTVVLFYDNADQDITMTILGPDNSTYLAATDIETAAGVASSVEVITLRNGTTDSFVAIWYNKSSEDIVARSYSGSGTALTGQFRIEDFPQSYNGTTNANTTYPLFSAAGKDSISGQSLCSGGFVVGYINQSNSSLLKSYWINGTTWDGTCPVISYPVFFNFNESIANNSIYTPNNIYRFNASINNSNGTVGIEFNGINFSATNLTSNGFNSTLSNLGAGTYSYYWWSYGYYSTYNKSTSLNYVVARNNSARPVLIINGSSSNAFIYNNTPILLNSTVGIGDSSANLSLYVNGSIIGQRAIEISNLTNFGNVSYTYNVTAFYLQSQNYTQSAITYNVTVLPGYYKQIYLVDSPQTSFFTSDTFDDPSFIVSDPANFLVVQLAISSGALPTGVSYDGSEMQRVGSGAFNSDGVFDAEIYYLENPSICDGCKLSINLDTVGDCEISFFTLANVNLTNPLENYTLITDVSQANVTTNITTYAYRSWLVDALALESAQASVGPNMTQTMNGVITPGYGGYKANVTPWHNSMTWNWTESKQLAHIVASFRPYFDVDLIPPQITLNSPATNAMFNFSAPINFNWSVTDDRDTSLICNITVDSINVVPNIVSVNGTSTNYTISNLSIGNHNWNVFCIDDSSYLGSSFQRVVRVLNFPPTNGSAVTINATLGINKTLEDLNIMTTLTDGNNHSINVTVRWYNGTGFLSNQTYNNSYSNGTTFIATLEDGNTTVGETWFANITLYDGFNQTNVRSNNITILETDPTMTLIFPPNNSVNVNYTNQNFSWDAEDVDSPQFVAAVSVNLSSLAISSCNDPYFNGSLTYLIYLDVVPVPESYFFVSPNHLECPTYLWSVVGFSTTLGQWATPFRFNVTGNQPYVTLNYPSNASILSSSSLTRFNWTAYDNNPFNQIYCNLTIDNVTYANNIGSLNGSMTNTSISGLSSGLHTWNISCLDSYSNSGNSTTQTFFINDAPYNGTALVINSTLGLNRTLEDLNVRTILLDQDNNTLNVTVRWYNNSILHLIQNYNNSYSNGTTFIASLDDGNTTRGQNWSVQLSITDGFGTFGVNSSNLTILNTPPNVALISPIHSTIFGFTFNMTNQVFRWNYTDDDNDSILNVSFAQAYISPTNCFDDYWNHSAGGIESARSITLSNVTQYQLQTPVDCEDGYTWAVNAYDGISNSSFLDAQDAVAYVFNYTPNVTLYLPLNFSLFSSGSLIRFNWTVNNSMTFSSSDNYLNCNLTLDNGVNRSISPILGNQTMNNLSISGVSRGIHYWNVSCQDWIDEGYGTGIVGTSLTRTFILNDAPYNGTALVLNSTLGLNRTLEDLNVRTILLDQDNNTLNVTVRWYNNSILHLIQNYNNSYSNGTTFIATLDDSHTTKGNNWTAGLTITDGFTTFNVNSTNLTIRNSLPNSTILSPINGTVTLNRTNQNFTFVTSDDDGDPYFEQVNFTLVAESTCVDANYNGQIWYDVENAGFFSLYDIGSGPFNCLIDNGDYYLWSVRATEDFQEYGPVTNSLRFDVQAYLNFVMNLSSVEFGNLDYLKSNDTSDNSPKPIIIVNQGNVKANVTFGASSLWGSVSNPSNYYAAKVDNATTNGISENGTFLASSSLISYTNIPLASSPAHLASSFNYTDDVDTMEVDLNVTVPSTEGPGLKNSTITFTFVLSHQEIYA